MKIDGDELMRNLLGDKDFIEKRISFIETEKLEYDGNLKFYRGQLFVIDAYIEAFKAGDYGI